MIFLIFVQCGNFCVILHSIDGTLTLLSWCKSKAINSGVFLPQPRTSFVAQSPSRSCLNEWSEEPYFSSRNSRSHTLQRPQSASHKKYLPRECVPGSNHGPQVTYAFIWIRQWYPLKIDITMYAVFFSFRSGLPVWGDALYLICPALRYSCKQCFGGRPGWLSKSDFKDFFSFGGIGANRSPGLMQFWLCAKGMNSSTIIRTRTPMPPPPPSGTQ